MLTPADTTLTEIVVVSSAPAPVSRPLLAIDIPSACSLPDLLADGASHQLSHLSLTPSDASACSSASSSPTTPDGNDRTFDLARKSTLNPAAASFVPARRSRSDLDPSTPAFVPGARVLPAYVRQRAQLSFEQYLAEVMPRIRAHMPTSALVPEFPRSASYYIAFPTSPSPVSRVHVGANRHLTVFLRPACHGRYKRVLETLHE